MKRNLNKKLKKKKRDDWLEKYIIAVMEKSLEATLNRALDEIMGKWK